MPDQCLRIDDYLDADAEHNFRQWLHLAPEFTQCEMVNGRILTSDGVQLVSIIPPTGARCFLYRGETNPLRGWRASGIGKMEPSWSIAFVLHGRSAHFKTEVHINTKNLNSEHIKKTIAPENGRDSNSQEKMYNLFIRNLNKHI